MKRITCFALCSVHLLALAISTYIAADEIRSILVTALICSATGVAAGLSAIIYKRRLLAIVGFSTPLIAVLLFLLEAFVMHLGPGDAALPFCIVFIINQVATTLITLIQFNILLARKGTLGKQITLRTLVVSMISFSVFFAIARHLLERRHDWLMGISLGLLGLTLVGLSVAMYSALANRNAQEIATR